MTPGGARRRTRKRRTNNDIESSSSGDTLEDIEKDKKEQGPQASLLVLQRRETDTSGEDSETNRGKVSQGPQGRVPSIFVFE